MDLHDRLDPLDQLTATVRGAKTMPMSASCLVNRAETLALLERLRDDIPAQSGRSAALLQDRKAVLATVREQAEHLLEDARIKREQLIEQTDVMVAARARAVTVTTEAGFEATRLLADADSYVDRKLAEFEALLEHLAAQVNNGRLRLTARREVDLARFQVTAQATSRGDDGHPDGSAESQALDPAFG